MKLTIVLTLFFTVNLFANGYGQQKISIKAKKMEVGQVLTTIEKQTNYRFLYNTNLPELKNTVSITAKEATITDVLQSLLTGTALTYQLMERNLIVIKEDATIVKDVPVTGKVVDDKGMPLAGVSVQVKGTNMGTTTNADGHFALTVPNANAILTFTSVGFDEKEYPLNGSNTVTITLVASQKVMDQVVVIGYGTASKRDLTGSIVKIDGKDIADKPNTNPVASLQGKVAGLSVVNNAIPGSAPDVRIRGTVSVGTTRPVYIIDGIFSDNMDFVNPSEIESMEILKDPSSLAVFGIKGAGGAILVTTKKAKAGQLNINFNTNVGTKKLVDKIQLANGDEFRQLLKFEAENRVKDDPTNSSLLSFVNNVGGPGLSAYTGNTDWIDAVTRVAKFSNTNLSLDGSSEKNRFHMGLGYSYDEGLVKHVKYERINININDEYRINKTWKVGFNFVGSKESLPYESGALENARRSLPIIPADTKAVFSKNPYGVDSANYQLYATTPIIQNSETNPLATLENNWNKKIDGRYRMIGSAFVDINITKDLNFRSTWYANMSNRNNREYTPLYNLYDPTKPEGQQVFAKNSLTAVKQELTETKSFQQDYIATYRKKIEDHSFTATAGFTTFYNFEGHSDATVSQSVPGLNIIPDDRRLWYINTGFGDKKSVITTANQFEYATVSFLGRILYNFKSKYYFNASFRRDGSSQISDNYAKKFQNFWAVGAAWEITKENFMEGQDVFSYLKLKASTGVLGNFTAQGKNYPAYPTISTSSSAVFGSNLVPVYVPDYRFDPNLRWETVSSTEVGIEGDLLKGDLHVEAAYYIKNTDGLIVLLTPVGQLPTLTNNGKIKNSGLEFSAHYRKELTKDFSFNIGGNLTTYKNKVTFLPNPLRTNISSSEQTPNQAETGYPIGYFYGLVVEGIYQSYQDILKSPTSLINGGGAKPGDLKYKDLNNDGVIDDKDRTMIGNPTPDFTYGITTALRYKNFDLGIDFNGCYGNEIFRVWGTSEQKNSVYNYPKNYTQAWTAEGTSNWVPIVNQNHLINRAPSTYGIEDGSYFRVRNLTVGYTFAQLHRINAVKNIRLSLGVQNLKTWKRNSGYSPEFAGDANTPATSFGMDFGGASSALPRIITVGLNMNF